MRRILLALMPVLLVCCSASKLEETETAKFTISDGVLDGLNINKERYSASFAVTSDADWEILRRTGAVWVNVSPSKGSGNATIKISADRNDTGAQRRAFFDVKLNGIPAYVIEITQSATGTENPGSGEQDSDVPSSEEKAFPILAWEDIPVDKSAERFPSMLEVGINTYLGMYESKAKALEVLDIAKNTGVRLFVQCPELLTSPEETARSLMNHPALYGYFVEDEPEIRDFGKWGDIVKKIQAVDNVHPCYINLYPNWAWGKLDKYEENVDAYLDAVPVQMLSFDNYPVISLNGAPNSLRYDWYYNLEVISAAAKEKNIPFWAFARVNSKEFDYEGDKYLYPVPTTEELRAQMFTNLAYGAQGLQYFTYWGIETNTGKTRAYERVQTVNREIQALAEVFLGCKVIKLGHTGQLPIGTKEFGTLPGVFSKLETSGGAIISHIENGDKYYLVVVNRDSSGPITLSLTADASVQRVLKTGVAEAVSLPSYTISAGNMEIFTWNK